MTTATHIDRARRYQRAIRTALMDKWDPIGVKGIVEADDEYDAYVGVIYKLLIEHRERSELLDYLWWLETQHMGLTGDRQSTERFADHLIELRDQLTTELESN